MEAVKICLMSSEKNLPQRENLAGKEGQRADVKEIEQAIVDQEFVRRCVGGNRGPAFAGIFLGASTRE